MNSLAAPWPSVAIGASGISILWLFGMRREAPAFAVIGSVPGLLGFLSGYTFEELVSRSRPQAGLSDGSYPSGHTLTGTLLFGFAGFLGVYYRLRKRYLAPQLGTLLLLIMSAGAARVHAQAHWPSDVVAGFLLGGLGLLVIAPLFLRCRKMEWLPSSICGPPCS